MKKTTSIKEYFRQTLSLGLQKFFLEKVKT